VKINNNTTCKVIQAEYTYQLLQDKLHDQYQQIEDLMLLLDKVKSVIPTHYVMLLDEIDQTLKKYKN